jgi:hypothetical protein
MPDRGDHKVKTNFTFTEEMIDLALRANGFYTLWNEANWVPPNASNPDWAGMSMLEAFKMLLKQKNLA